MFVCSTAHYLSWKELVFQVPESTSSDLNAVANSAGPDESIHKEQSGQGQHCVPSYTGSFNSVKL